GYLESTNSEQSTLTPRRIIVAAFCTKIDSSKCRASTASTPKVKLSAVTLTTNETTVATTPRYSSKRMNRSSGNAISSARVSPAWLSLLISPQNEPALTSAT